MINFFLGIFLMNMGGQSGNSSLTFIGLYLLFFGGCSSCEKEELDDVSVKEAADDYLVELEKQYKECGDEFTVDERDAAGKGFIDGIRHAFKEEEK